MPRTNTFEHLEGLCRSHGIVCERTGRKIELTTPDGSVKAECATLAEALDTVRHDPTFSKLPIKINQRAVSDTSQQKSELYHYKLVDHIRVINTTRATTLDEAMLNFGGGFDVESWFLGMATVKRNKIYYGVTWQPV